MCCSCRWHAATDAARSARERLAKQLAASDPTLGRRGERRISNARRRQRVSSMMAAAAGEGWQQQQQQHEGDEAALVMRDDLDAMLPQVGCVRWWWGGGDGALVDWL